jgi:hypothetical protein
MISNIGVRLNLIITSRLIPGSSITFVNNITLFIPLYTAHNTMPNYHYIFVVKIELMRIH